MSVENPMSFIALNKRNNGVFHPSARVQLSNELVRIDKTLKNIGKQGVNFAMNEEFIKGMERRQEELSQRLGLPQDKTARARSIDGLDGYLRRIGFPYWQINFK